MNTTDQLFNNTILFQDTENIEGTVKKCLSETILL